MCDEGWCVHAQVAGTSKVRGNLVLQFMTGNRALAALSAMLARETGLSAVRSWIS